jgi:hypothetical protein
MRRRCGGVNTDNVIYLSWYCFKRDMSTDPREDGAIFCAYLPLFGPENLYTGLIDSENKNRLGG